MVDSKARLGSAQVQELNRELGNKVRELRTEVAKGAEKLAEMREKHELMTAEVGETCQRKSKAVRETEESLQKAEDSHVEERYHPKP